jgi:anti-sigma factor RsiW
MTMNCQDLREQLHPYLDGELDPPLALTIERALEDCPDCKAELDELQALRLMARAALEGPVAEVDLSQMAGDVMARLQSEGVLRERAASPEGSEAGLMTWLKSLLTFEQPMMSMAALAIALLAVAAIAFNATSSEDAAGPEIASPTPTTAPTESVATAVPPVPAIERRSGVTLEAGQHAAFVEHVEAAKGRVVVDDNTDDPSKPMVVWHHVDEGAALPIEGDTPGQEL